MKTCGGCDKRKSLEDFHRNRASSDGRAHWCKSCCSDYQRSEKGKAAHARYVASGKGKEKIAQYLGTDKAKVGRLQAAARYRASENGKVMRARYAASEQGKAMKARYVASEKGRATRARYYVTETATRIRRRVLNRYRAQKAGAEGNHSHHEFHALCEAAGFRCLACGEKKPLTEDHIVPVSLGGSDWISNIQPLCISCNARKGARIIDYRGADDPRHHWIQGALCLKFGR